MIKTLLCLLFICSTASAMTVDVKEINLGKIPDGFFKVRGWDAQTGNDYLKYHGKHFRQHLVSSVGYSSTRAPFWLIDEETGEAKILNLNTSFGGDVISLNNGFLLSGAYSGTEWFDGARPESLPWYRFFPFFTSGGRIGIFTTLPTHEILNVTSSDWDVLFVTKQKSSNTFPYRYKYSVSSHQFDGYQTKIVQFAENELDLAGYHVNQLFLTNKKLLIRTGQKLLLLDEEFVVKATQNLPVEMSGIKIFNVNNEKFAIAYNSRNKTHYNLYSSQTLELLSSNVIFNENHRYFTSFEANNKNYFYPDVYRKNEFVTMNDQGAVETKCSLPYFYDIYPGMAWGYSSTLAGDIAIFDLYRGNNIAGGPLALVDLAKCKMIGHLDLKTKTYTEVVKGYDLSEVAIVVTGGKVFKLTFESP